MRSVISRCVTISMALPFLLLAACSSDISVGTDFNAGVDFSTYRSYRWHEGNEFNLRSQQFLASDLADQRIRSNVDSKLLGKGIRLRESGPVDFLINYSVTTVEQVDIDSYNTYSGYAPGWTYGGYAGLGPYRYGGVGLRYSYGTPGTETRVSQYTRGTLILDMVEPVGNTLVWRGIAEGKLEQDMNQNERAELVEDAVNRILDGFPPQAN